MDKKSYIKTEDNIFEVFTNENGERYFLYKTGETSNKIYEEYWQYEHVLKESGLIMSLIDNIVVINKKTLEKRILFAADILLLNFVHNPDYEVYLYMWNPVSQDLIRVAQVNNDEKIILLQR